MQVRALRNGDVDLDGVEKALFAGQIYDLPEPLVQEHDWLEIVEDEKPAVEEAQPEENVEEQTEKPEEKAVEAPPQDKAVRPRRNK